jgi:hypothetical protein
MSHYTTDLPFTAYNFRCYKRQSFYAYHRNPLHQLYPQFWLITGNTTQHLTIQSIVQHIYTEFITISPVYFIGSSGRPDTALFSFWYHCRPIQFNRTILSQASLTSSTALLWQSIKCCLQRCYCSSICCSTNCRYQHEYLVISAAGAVPLLGSLSLQCCYCSSISYNFLTVSPVYSVGSSSHNALVLMLIDSEKCTIIAQASLFTKMHCSSICCSTDCHHQNDV